jgi:hypothetical protein
MGSKSIRDERKARRKKGKTKRNLLWIGIGIVVAIIIGFVAWTIFKPAAGESVPIMANAGDHVQPGSDPGPFNSNPPTSGRHYGQEFEAGFYEETDSEVQNEFPEGYLIHNLEHGYIIFWYNCDLLDEASCSNLKSQIKGVMDEFNNFKVIGFPRSTIEVPLVMTSWGRTLPFDTFNADAASDFVRSNRNRAPEPNAP